jgi:hypothetical protein
MRQFPAPAEGDDHRADDDGDGGNEQDHGHKMNRAMLKRMVTRAPGPAPGPGTALLAVAGNLDEAAVAITAGADLVDLGSASLDVIAEFRRRHPGSGLCCDSGPGDLVRDLSSAPASALLLCADAAAARASGLPAGRLVVEVTPGAAAAAAAAGWAALVDADLAAADVKAADLGAAGVTAAGVSGAAVAAAVTAMAALSCWLGAAFARTRHVRSVRRALDMAASIRGDRPPARTVRGLA